VAELFASGRIIDLILALVAVEAVVLLAYAYRTGRGISPAGLLSNLAAGLFLLLALRTTLLNQSWILVASLLTAALFAHVIDLSHRWRR
jgi:uncharacterized membrane protein YGL010W